MSDIEIRPVRPTEHAHAGEIVVEAYLQLGRIDDRYEASIADVGGRVAAGAEVLVAVHDGRVVGSVTYAELGNPAFEGHGMGDATFRMLGVDPAAQGLGAGRALVEACIARARASGRHRISIYSMVWMPGAHALYRSLGFERRPDRDVEFPGGAGWAFQLPLTEDADAAFPPPRAQSAELPWFEDVWDGWAEEARAWSAATGR